MKIFGLDIGSHTLKVAQVEKAGNQYRLVALGMSPAPAGGILSEAVNDQTQLSEAIKKLKSEAKITTNNVAAALPEDKIFTRVIEMPLLKEDELESAIKWEAEQYIPLPLDEVTLDYQIASMPDQKASQEKKMEVLLVASPKQLIDRYLKVLEGAGLRPASLETEIIAIARSVAPPDSTPVLVVDLGARATDMAIVDKGQIVFTRSIGTAGEALTRAVATELKLEPGQAEEYKKAYGVDPKQLEGKVKGAIGPILDVVVKEMEKALEFYRSRHKETPVSRAVLTGGTAGLPEVVSLIAQKLGIEAQLADPFTRLIKEGEILAKLPEGTSPLYAIAMGLALKEVS